jgi:hypothetical protein
MKHDLHKKSSAAGTGMILALVLAFAAQQALASGGLAPDYKRDRQFNTWSR